MTRLMLTGLVSALLVGCDGQSDSNSTDHVMKEPAMALSEVLDSLPGGWEVSYATIDDKFASDVQFKSPEGDYYKGDRLAGSQKVLTLTGNLHAQLPIGFMRSLGTDDRIEISPGSGVASLKGKWEVEPFKTIEEPAVPNRPSPPSQKSKDPVGGSDD
jgi:hypothetical protein